MANGGKEKEGMYCGAGLDGFGFPRQLGSPSLVELGSQDSG